MTRRRALGIGGALGLMAATGLSASAALARRPSVTGAELRSAVPLPPPFQLPLPIPAVLKPVSTSGGVDRYEITQREASAEILPGVRTPLWTYEGAFPGPTIESRRGRPVTVTHRNELPVPTVVHLHGGRTLRPPTATRPTWSCPKAGPTPPRTPGTAPRTARTACTIRGPW
ncbi:multicopper oxidase domain-containing protein [Nonomuraea recticatena]|uniref:multicopper oxidase domain-containing protein n=1 Tax=Nonomuraea recticatena TaxID=46178 RepID=UPI003607FCE8